MSEDINERRINIIFRRLQKLQTRFEGSVRKQREAFRECVTSMENYALAIEAASSLADIVLKKEFPRPGFDHNKARWQLLRAHCDELRKGLSLNVNSWRPVTQLFPDAKSLLESAEGAITAIDIPFGLPSDKSRQYVNPRVIHMMSIS